MLCQKNNILNEERLQVLLVIHYCFQELLFSYTYQCPNMKTNWAWNFTYIWPKSKTSSKKNSVTWKRVIFIKKREWKTNNGCNSLISFHFSFTRVLTQSKTKIQRIRYKYSTTNPPTWMKTYFYIFIKIHVVQKVLMEKSILYRLNWKIYMSFLILFHKRTKKQKLGMCHICKLLQLLI